MKRLLGLLMVVGILSGCGGDSDNPTGPSDEITKGPEGQILEVNTEEKWSNGNIKVEFKYYRDGGSVVKHGFYREYDKDGTLRVDGTYFEDKEKYNGKWIEYDGSGKIESEGNYKDGKFDGKWVGYYDNGKIRVEGNYVDGKLEGKYVWYYSNGKIESERNYVDGIEDGKWVRYDREGNIISEWCWEMGEEVDCP